jgi:hypothetical protein
MGRHNPDILAGLGGGSSLAGNKLIHGRWRITARAASRSARVVVDGWQPWRVRRWFSRIHRAMIYRRVLYRSRLNKIGKRVSQLTNLRVTEKSHQKVREGGSRGTKIHLMLAVRRSEEPPNNRYHLQSGFPVSLYSYLIDSWTVIVSDWTWTNKLVQERYYCL